MSERIEELNQRIFARVQASETPSILFSPRPVCTKYVKFPVVNDPVRPTVKLEPFSKHVDFLPSDAKGPGALDLVDVESTLKNMDFALQRSGHAVYVPPSKSSLYNTVAPRAQKVQQPYPNLFAHVVTSNSGIPADIKPSATIFNEVRLRTPN
jgi:hypothetical protein